MEALKEVASFLSAEQNNGEMTCSALDEKTFRISTPCLSLKHTKGLFSSQTRDQAEEYASALLARPLQELLSGEQHESSFSIGRSLLENVYSSLAVLVDCRLHAYVAFLARRISSAKGEDDDVEVNRTRMESESKLVNLIETGTQVSAKRITTHFVVTDHADGDEMSVKDKTCHSSIRLDVCMDLNVPRYHGVTVRFSTTGTMEGELGFVSCEIFHDV